MRTKMKKSIAALAVVAFALNMVSNILSSRRFRSSDEDIFDILDGGRRLDAVTDNSYDMQMTRRLVRRTRRVKRALNVTTKTKVTRRQQRAELRKLKRALDISDEAWKGTLLNMTVRNSVDGRHLTDELHDSESFSICDRPTNLKALANFGLLSDDYSTCPRSDTRDMLLLEGKQAFGRTGNNLIEFLHALQFSREQDIIIGVMENSWALRVLTKMWMAIKDRDDWERLFEENFCVKILHSEEELKGWNIIRKTTKELFYTPSNSPFNEYVSSTMYSIRTLFQYYNTGKGTDINSQPVKDMCSGINAIFGEQRSQALYSVIHSRSLEGNPGIRLLRAVCNKARCDTRAALEMRPDYIKSILAPLGMLRHPIVLITDGQDPSLIQRLMADPDIGPMLQLVPEEACWIGGDWTLAVMSNVFIGNPASTFSTFVAKSRISLGFGHNYLFRVKNDEDEWVTSCGDGCVFMYG